MGDWIDRKTSGCWQLEGNESMHLKGSKGGRCWRESGNEWIKEWETVSESRWGHDLGLIYRENPDLNFNFRPFSDVVLLFDSQYLV